MTQTTITTVDNERALARRADDWTDAAVATTPADRATAEAGVRRAYAAAGLTPPTTITWCDSPLAAARTAARVSASGELGRSVRGEVRTRPWAAARAEAMARLGAAGWARHWAAAGARPWRLVMESLFTPIRTRVIAELVEADKLTDVAAAMVMLDSVGGQHDAAWLGAFAPSNATSDAAITDSVITDAAMAEAIAALAAVAASAGWWWPYEDGVILTERPTALLRDNVGRLHHGDGPALSFPDGWSMFAWRGMPIPPSVADELAHLTVERIRDEDNAEIRRVMVEYFGFDRYLRESKAQRLHEDECGILWRVPLDGDEPLVMVEVINSTPEPDGTSRTYFLRVPPNVTTARGGVAWTFGLTEDEYAPLVQS